MKHEIIKRVLRFTSFILVLLLILLLLSYAFKPKNASENHLGDVKPNGLLAEPENTIDVLFFGDSEAYTSLSPIQMWSNAGFTSFVCASSSQYISLTQSFVEQSLEHQKPKVVVLETNAFYRKMRSDNAFMTRLENMFSIIQYHNRWKSMLPIKFNSVSYTWKDDAKGFKYSKITTKGKTKNYMKKTDKVFQMPALNAAVVKEIVAYCNENNVKVLFLSTPSSKNWNYAKHNAVSLLARECGAEYLDLNLEKSIRIDWKTDTADAGDHLNYKGAHKVGDFLGPYLSKAYLLKNKKNDSAFESWNEIAEQYRTLFASMKDSY